VVVGSAAPSRAPAEVIVTSNPAKGVWVKAGSHAAPDGNGNDVAETAERCAIPGVEARSDDSPAGYELLGTCAQYQKSSTRTRRCARCGRIGSVDRRNGAQASMRPEKQVTERPCSRRRRRSRCSESGVVVPQSSVGWPTIPNVLYTGLVTIREVLNLGRSSPPAYGPSPARRRTRMSPVRGFEARRERNEAAAFALPPITVPLATGWLGTAWRLVRRAGWLRVVGHPLRPSRATGAIDTRSRHPSVVDRALHDARELR